MVKTLAQRKAETVAPQFESALIMGCDSVLAVNGEIHGKPADAEQARQRWQKMQGGFGDLYTGHAFIDNTQLCDRTINTYVATGEPLKCAGAFALEGRGGLFIEKLEGCHSNVIGLSLPLLRQMLTELGYNITDFWR